MSVDIDSLFSAFEANLYQKKLLSEAGLKGPEDPRFHQILRASVDFVYHAELFMPDPNDPEEPLRLEPWQKQEISYAQHGEAAIAYNPFGYFPAGQDMNTQPSFLNPDLAKQIASPVPAASSLSVDLQDDDLFPDLDTYFDRHFRSRRKYVSINSPRGFGKSCFSSVLADEFAIHFPYTKIALFSTSQDQANDLMAKVKYNIQNSIYSFMIDRKINSQTHLGLINGSEIKAFPQSEVTIRGYHPQIKIIDEKARIKREILESAIRPMGRKVCWLEVGISTPFGRNNNHYEDCTNPEVFHIRLLKPTDVSWVDEEKLALEVKTMGERFAKQELFAEFLEDSDLIFRPALIENMLDLRLEPVLAGHPEFKYFMGVDYGKHRDYTGICIAHFDKRQNVVIDLLERHLKEDYKVIINRMWNLCNDFNCVLITADGSGVGAPILEEVRDRIKVPLYISKVKSATNKKKEEDRLGFIFTPQSKMNLVTLMEKTMSDNRIRCPHHGNTKDKHSPVHIFKVLEEEMLNFTYTLTPFGNIKLGHMEDGKSHDDTLMAVMLCVWGMSNRRQVNYRIAGQKYGRDQGGRDVSRYFGYSPRGPF